MTRRPEIPAETRRSVLGRCAGKCEGCGEKKALGMHHLRYISRDGNGRKAIFGHEQPEDLQALCWQCHRKAHTCRNGFFWRYPRIKDRF